MAARPEFGSPLLAVPNFSAGPAGPGETDAIGAVGAALGERAAILDLHTDADHNRSVFTLAASDAGLAGALEAGAAAAIAAIDLRAHAGAHPRIGALDVSPVVYTDPALAGAARELALEVGERLAALELPVFLYGELATSEERRERHFFRVGGFESLAARMAAGELAPDLGPPAPHPSAGAVLVTARAPLAAFNIELEGVELAAGREIAAALRESGGGLTGVRALAIELGDGTLQISTNVHDPVAMPLAAVVAETERLAAAAGGRAVAAELVGLIPEAALTGYPEHVPIRGFDPSQRTIEARLAAGG
jgi:glutamate formiminotransferase